MDAPELCVGENIWFVGHGRDDIIVAHKYCNEIFQQRMLSGLLLWLNGSLPTKIRVAFAVDG
jgi:hypothetical protein